MFLNELLLFAACKYERTRHAFTKVPAVEVCDATMLNSNSKAGYIKNIFPCLFTIHICYI